MIAMFWEQQQRQSPSTLQLRGRGKGREKRQQQQVAKVSTFVFTKLRCSRRWIHLQLHPISAYVDGTCRISLQPGSFLLQLQQIHRKLRDPAGPWHQDRSPEVQWAPDVQATDIRTV